MSPVPFATRFLRSRQAAGSTGTGQGSWRDHATQEGLILESWSEGLMVGSLMIMSCITVANMRKGVVLHKLILTEQLLALTHGTFCFMNFKGYGFYLSATAALLYTSWVIHNIVAWIKIRPFFLEPNGVIDVRKGKTVQYIYLGALSMTVPVIIFQIFNNFEFFSNLKYSYLYARVRPYEPLMRDPWWAFTVLVLFYVIKKGWEIPARIVISSAPRFGILMAAMCLSIIFTSLDIVASIDNFIGGTDGINPWWKLSLIFKCLTDAILLDDFKTELQRLAHRRMQRADSARGSISLAISDDPEMAETGDRRVRDAVSPPAFLRFNRFRNHKQETLQSNTNPPQQSQNDPFEFATSALSRQSSGAESPTARGSNNYDDNITEVSGANGHAKTPAQKDKCQESLTLDEALKPLPEVHNGKPK